MSENYCLSHQEGFPRGAGGKDPTCQGRRHETRVPSLGQEDPLEKEMATHSSFLAWETPWTEEPDGLQSMGLQRVGHDSLTKQKQQHIKIAGGLL